MVVLRSQRVLFDGKIQPADLVLEHDYISEVLAYGAVSEAFDCGRKLISPGFIDLHSDSVEQEIEPRPGAEFPVRSALVELDKKLTMAGITTMFHAIAFNDESLVGRRGTKVAMDLISQVCDCNSSMLHIDNLVHARYEITSFCSLPAIKQLIDTGKVQLLSLMDHSPGQGQFRSLEQWKKYHVPVFKLTEDKAREIIDEKQDKKSNSQKYLEDLVGYARERNILLASHDDDSCEKIDLLHELGITIAEFPLNIETASHARSKGMATGMGAPNVVRGRSQSGNISARELLTHGHCDFLCSDYHPTSMLQAVYAISVEMGWELADALTCITSTPATIARLDDRGEIAAGKLADLVVIDDEDVAKVVMTLKAGIPVYNGNGCFCMNKAA
jgi:alpha-D-ribose 1-methylphosphonate 5-triphosphate diphosphatase